MQSKILLESTALCFVRAQVVRVSFIRVWIRAVPLAMRHFWAVLISAASCDYTPFWHNFNSFLSLYAEYEPRLDAFSAVQTPHFFISDLAIVKEIIVVLRLLFTVFICQPSACSDFYLINYFHNRWVFFASSSGHICKPLYNLCDLDVAILKFWAKKSCFRQLLPVIRGGFYLSNAILMSVEVVLKFIWVFRC